jgi:hypothetical protein
MTVEVAQTSNTNTWQYFVNRVNELADAMSNVAVTTDSNTASGNAAISGTFTSNALVSGSVKVTNSTSNVTISVPNTAAVSSGNYYLNANGSWGIIISPISEGNFSTTGTSQQEIDSYSTSEQNGAEYFIHIKNNSANGYQASKILTVHNGNTAAAPNAYATEYAIVTSNGVLGVFEASSNGSHVKLLMTPSFGSTLVTFSRVNF